MGRHVRQCLGALALAGCALTGCTAAGPHQVRPPPPSRTSGSSVPNGVAGSPGNPLVLSCAAAAVGGTGPIPGPHDLVSGPLDILGGKLLATADPVGYGNRGNYKIPIAIGPGATVTVTIAPQARGRVVIYNPYGPASGVAAATYRSCQPGWTVFPQGFVFPDHEARGCVPLDVRAGGQPRTRHLTVSLFAGSCGS